MTTTAQTLTIADFLLARIAEEEFDARSSREIDMIVDPTALTGSGSLGSRTYRHVRRWTPERILEDCKRKRRIIDMRDALNYPLGPLDWMRVPSLRRTMDLVLAELAAAYRDHPDYRREWRP